MKNWNRRDSLRMIGLTTLGLGLSSFATPLIGNTATNSDAEDIKRLLYNENPYGPSEESKKMIAQNIDRSNRYCTFHQYDYQALKELIANQEGLKSENILLGHGSFEPLTWLAIHFGRNNGEIIVPSPTFDVIGLIGRKTGAKVLPVEVTKDFKMNLPEMESRVSAQTKLLTICNPNNPTGTSIEPRELKNFCREVSKKCPVLIDEAYIHFLPEWQKKSMASLIAEGSNILVVRTFSKIYGMAGLRIGFLMGPADIITELESTFTLGFPGNMPNALSVAAAIGALKDSDFVKQSRKRNAEGREQLYKTFDALNIPFIKSQTNFVYFDVVKFPAFKALMRKNNIVLAGGWPSKPNWARVTIGTPEDMDYFVSKIKDKGWM